MKRMALMVMCGTGILLAVGALPGTRTPTLWEYGVYTESASSFDWQDAARWVLAPQRAGFFRQMGIPSATNLRPDRITALVLNHLGQQGWELVQVSAADGTYRYWFRRPVNK